MQGYKKIYFLLFLGFFYSVNVFAVDTIGCGCPGYNQVCCNPTTKCCANSQAECATVCKTEIEDKCPDECPWTAVWKETTNNREARCKSTVTGGCYYRCKDGYYNRGAGFGQPTGSLTCSACPDNATCTDGSGLAAGETPPKCYKNYYGSKITGLIPPSYTCTICPGVKTAGSMPISMTGRTKSAGATSITSCYIPSGKYQEDKGIYSVSSDCYYGS